MHVRGIKVKVKVKAGICFGAHRTPEILNCREMARLYYTYTTGWCRVLKRRLGTPGCSQSIYKEPVYLKGSPTGLIPSTMCRLARTRSIRKAYIAAGVSSTLAFLAASANALRTYAQSTNMTESTQKSVNL